MIFGSDGKNFWNMGSTKFDSDGKNFWNCGNTTFGSNGNTRSDFENT